MFTRPPCVYYCYYHNRVRVSVACAIFFSLFPSLSLTLHLFMLSINLWGFCYNGAIIVCFDSFGKYVQSRA